jgi:DNA-binding SARP family transcriptional activator
VTADLITVSLFGQFVLRREGALVTLPTEKSRALLAYLLIETRELHRRVQLAELLWPQLPRPRALHNLTIALGAIRRLHNGLIEPDSETVGINRARWQVDAVQFGVLLAHVDRHQHRAPDQCPLCAARCAGAAALVQGPLLADLVIADAEPFNDWLQLNNEQLHEQWVTALMTAAGFARRRADFQAVRRRLLPLFRNEPWREDVLRELMAATTALGERNRALQLYHRAVSAVRQHLNAAPEPASAALAAAIRDDRYRVPPVPLLRCRALPTAFFGRSDLLTQLLDRCLAPQNRLISLIGIGGSGKTYLAFEAARQLHGAFDGGIVLVECSGINDPTTLLLSIAAAVGCDVTAGAPLERQIAVFLGSRGWLLILDDLTALANRAAAMSGLLSMTPTLSLLLTAHRPCGLQIEQVLTVGAFDTLAEAADFLQQRATALLPTTAAVIPAETAAALVSAAGGLPLAIDLIVHRLQVQTPQQVIAQLTDEPETLAVEIPDVAPRHRQLERLFSRSWQQLTPAAVLLLAAFSCVQTALPAAEAAELARMAGGPPALAQQLSDQGLLQAVAGTLSMHPLLRSYAMRHTAAHDSAATAQVLFARLLLQQLTGAELQRMNDHTATAAARLMPRYSDLRSAWLLTCAAADPTPLIAAANGLMTLLSYLNWFDALTELMEQAAARFSGDDAARLLLYAASTALHAARSAPESPNRARSRRLIDQARKLALSRPLQLRAEGLIASHYHESGDSATACSHFAAIDLSDPTLPDGLIAEVCCNYATSAMVAGDYPLAQRQAERSLAAGRRMNDLAAIVMAQSILAQLPARSGDYLQALPLLEEALADARRYGVRLTIVLSLGNLAYTRALAGRPAAEVLPLLDELEQLTREVGGAQRLATVLHSIASSALACGALSRARRALDEARTIALTLPATVFKLHLLEGYGWLALQQQRRDDALLLLHHVVVHPATSAYVRRNAVHLLNAAGLPAADSAAAPLDDPALAALLRSC